MGFVRFNFKALSLKSSKPKDFYIKEAKTTIKKYNIDDKYFSYFVREILNGTKESLDIEDLRDIVSCLQKYICKRINQEESVVYIPIKNKIKVSKKNYYDKFEYEEEFL